MSKKKKIIISSIVMLIIFISLSFGVYAIMASTSTRSKFKVSSDTITATSTYTSSTSSFDLVFNQAGDYKEISIATQNSTNTVLHNKYQITSTASSDLFKAILVYLNGDYVGTLNNVISPSNDIDEDYGFIPLRTTRTDTFKFELHQSAIASSLNLNGQNALSITINTYTENADYLDFIYVKTDSDFKKALDDINSGVYATNPPTIILCGDVSLSTTYRIVNPTTIYLNGYSLSSGTLLINDDNETTPDALLKVVGDGTLSSTVTLGGYYDEEAAKELVADHVKEAIGEGVSPRQSVDLLGHYAFYSPTITAGSYCTYSKPNLSVPNTTNQYYTKVDYITVNGEKIEFKVRGSQTALVSKTLSYLPQTNSIVTNDLFLPTYIPSQNATITWKSSNEAIITSDGRIAATKIENEKVSLYAEIKVNNTVYTEQYDFKVAAHTNEIHFYKLVQEISPIVISNVYSSAADADDALYHLPIVSQNNDGTFNDYDYRTSYSSPVTTQMFNWSAYNDIGIESLTYSMTSAQQTAYPYITQSGNELYLNTTTLNNYANITVTGNFGNNETYTTLVNISISVGSNTQLLEKAFAQVSDDVDKINVLGNILKTRIESGMANEKGDFELASVFENDSDYTIEYSGVSDIIPSITKDTTNNVYKFAINPEYFNEYETTVAFTATVYYKKGDSAETSKSRTFYVTVPAALHVSDFGTISIYNSTKYQVYNQLPNNEKQYSSGYSLSGTTLSDSNINYILLRDIVGDAKYVTDYSTGNDNSYLGIIEYTSSSQYAKGVETLKYNTSSTSQSAMTDQAAYDFARLIEWATGTTRVAASTVVSTSTPLGAYASNRANAEDYLNDDEIDVIKAWYEYYTGASFSTIENEILNQAPGYIYTNPELLNQVIVCLSTSGVSFYKYSFSNIFGKYMEVIQRYAVSTTKVNTHDAAPCQDIYNTRFRWVESDTDLFNTTYTYNGNDYTIDYSVKLNNGKYWNRYQYSGSTSGGDSGGNPTSYALYASDRTSYITENELTVLRAFWLNAVSSNTSETGLNNGLKKAITGTNLSSITSILTANAGLYYSGFSSTDFDTVGEAILNGFDACLEIPTYFTADGISILLKHFYSKFNKNSIKYELNAYGDTGKTFNSVVNNGIPYVTNLDNLKTVLTYFVNLSDLEINGNSNLAAFLSENGLSTLFARVGLNNTLINKLILKNVAHTNTDFDLSNISNYENLTYLDISDNKGIQSVNELVNVNRNQYTYVNICNIGVEYAYQEFAIDNIASSTCTVYYTDADNNQQSSTDDSMSSYLAELSDFDDFVTKYKYMTNVIQNDDNTTTNIVWRLEDGNAIGSEVTAAGKYPSISSVSAMNEFVSPYYYAMSNFTYNGTNFRYGNLYKANYNNGTLSFTSVGSYLNGDEISFDSIELEEPEIPNNYTPTTTQSTPTSELTTAGSESVYDTYTYYSEASSSKTITITLQSSLFYYTYSGWFSSTNYYIVGSSTGSFGCSTSSSNGTLFAALTETEAQKLYNKEYNSNTTIGTSSPSGSYYIAFVENGNLYFISSTVSSGGNITATTDFSSARLITVSSGYTLKNSNYYLYFSYETSWGSISSYSLIYSSSSSSWNKGSGNSSYSYSYTLPKFSIYYNNGTYEQHNAYSAGYEIRAISGEIRTFTQIEQTVEDSKYGTAIYYYYTGNNTTYNGVSIKKNTVIEIKNKKVYTVASRTRTCTLTSTYYVLYYWYIINNGDSKTYVDGTTVDYIKYDKSSGETTHYKSSITIPGRSEVLSDWSDNWSTPLTSTWSNSVIVATPYISHVKNVSLSDYESITTMKEMMDLVGSTNNIIYKYSGTTASENVYKQSTTATSPSYTNNYGYKLTLSNYILTWVEYSSSLNEGSGTTMVSLLNTANSHFGDYQYGKYYGMYYGYYGADRYISSGIYLKQQYIYRIMPNATNTAFEWVEIGRYLRDTSDNILLKLGTGEIGVGTLAYSTKKATFGFFNDKQFYKVVIDDKTNLVNLVRFSDVNFATTNGSYTTLTNLKRVARSGDYLGFSGTFTIKISAMIRKSNGDGTYTEYIKTYKVKFVGSLYET